MNKVDELWNILCDAVSQELRFMEMYCSPITGGLDSRVLCGIMLKLGYDLRLSYWIRTLQNADNVEHIMSLRVLLLPDYFHIIDVPHLPDDFPYAIEKLGLMQDLKMYSFVMALNMDVYTGMLKTHKKQRAYFKNTFPQMWDDTVRNYKPFQRVITPFENPRVVGWLMSLSRRDRFFQKLYMEMIQEYLPELAEVPRCFEKGTGEPTKFDNNWSYMIARALEQWTII